MFRNISQKVLATLFLKPSLEKIKHFLNDRKDDSLEKSIQYKIKQCIRYTHLYSQSHYSILSKYSFNLQNLTRRLLKKSKNWIINGFTLLFNSHPKRSKLRSSNI